MLLFERLGTFLSYIVINAMAVAFGVLTYVASNASPE